jgi:hypothetical protein
MRIPFDQLGNITSSRGISGKSEYFSEPALLAFEDRPLIRVYEVDLFIGQSHGATQELPSLLGRDVINHWYMQYDPTNAKLAFVVRHADYTVER